MTGNRQRSKTVYLFNHKRCVVCGSRQDRINGATQLVLTVGYLNAAGAVVQRQSVMGWRFAEQATKA